MGVQDAAGSSPYITSQPFLQAVLMAVHFLPGATFTPAWHAGRPHGLCMASATRRHSSSLHACPDCTHTVTRSLSSAFRLDLAWLALPCLVALTHPALPCPCQLVPSRDISVFWLVDSVEVQGRSHAKVWLILCFNNFTSCL